MHIVIITLYHNHTKKQQKGDKILGNFKIMYNMFLEPHWWWLLLSVLLILPFSSSTLIFCAFLLLFRIYSISSYSHPSSPLSLSFFKTNIFPFDVDIF